MPIQKTPKMPPETFNHLFGSPTALSKLLNVRLGTVCMWRRRGLIPARYVETIERGTGVPRHLIRPDIFSAKKPRRQEAA
jgi:hypothetical protein